MKSSDLTFDNTEHAFSYKSNRELRQAHGLFSLMNSNLLVRMGTWWTPRLLAWGFPVKGLIRSTIFRQFCGGETLEECAATARRLGRSGVETILDYGVEGMETEAVFDANVREMKKAIEAAAASEYIPFVSMKVTGYGRFSLLEKVHQGTPLTDTEKQEWLRIGKRIEEVCSFGASKDVGVMIDAEETWIQQPVDDMAAALMKRFNRTKAVVYNTAQLYRVDRLGFLRECIRQAKAEGYILGMKLVRGAYMEKERRRAEAMGYPSPIQPDKASTDRDFNLAVDECLDHLDLVSVCIATHNERSNMRAVEQAGIRGLKPDHPHMSFSQLLGMSDHITFNLAHAGYRVSKYVPYGPVKDVVPYLMRRARENTSVGGMTSRELTLIRRELQRRSRK